MEDKGRDIPAKKSKTETPTKADGGQTSQWITVPESPPKFITIDQLMSAANGVKNMTLAHEIAVDNDFKLASPSQKATGIEKQVRDIMNKAFWDSLQDQLQQQPPDYKHVLTLLEELKETLLSLTLPQNTRIRSQIEEVFDMVLIKQQIEHKSLDVNKYTDYVINTLSRICAPVRDDDIEKLRNEKNLVPLFRGVFELMETMKMDMANFTISQIRPYIQQQSVEYERNKFNEFLDKQKEAGVDGLLLTRQWLQSAYQAAAASQTTPTSSATAYSSQSNAVTPASVLNDAYLMLLSHPLYSDLGAFPETLLMDIQRFCDLQQNTWKVTLVSAMLLVTYNTVGSPIAGISGLKEKLKSQILIILESCTNKEQVTSKSSNVSDQVIKEIDVVLTEHSFPVLTESQKNSLKSQISDVISEDNSVHKVIRDRIYGMILPMMSKDQKGPIKIPSGLTAVEQELTKICGQFLRLVAYNRSVFSEHYGAIIDNCLQRVNAITQSPAKPISNQPMKTVPKPH